MSVFQIFQQTQECAIKLQTSLTNRLRSARTQKATETLLSQIKHAACSKLLTDKATYQIFQMKFHLAAMQISATSMWQTDAAERVSTSVLQEKGVLSPFMTETSVWRDILMTNFRLK